MTTEPTPIDRAIAACLRIIEDPEIDSPQTLSAALNALPRLVEAQQRITVDLEREHARELLAKLQQQMEDIKQHHSE